MSEVTRVLQSIESGKAEATEELFPLVYDELRRLAAAKMAHEKPGQTLQATALVHEAWLNLVDPNQTPWNSRGHFFAAAAEAMRRILIAKARSKRREKRGGGWQRVPLEQVEVAEQADSETLEKVNEALERLSQLDSQKTELIKLRFFVGLSNREAAEMLGISTAKATRQWAFARAWLLAEIAKDVSG